MLLTNQLWIDIQNSVSQLGDYTSDINQIASNMKRCSADMSRLTCMMSLIFGSIGALRIYYLWNHGEREVMKMVSDWGWGLLFINIANLFIETLFL